MLGLLAIARRQKRDLAVIHFSGPNQLRTSVFPKGESSPLELIEAVEFFFGGGTVFDRWMEEAARFVDQDRFDRADVIVISDGIASISKQTETEWWKRKAERRMRSYAVLIGEARGLEVLGRISDAVMTLDDLKDALDRAGFPDFLPDPPTPRKSLRRALQAWVVARARAAQAQQIIAQQTNPDEAKRTLIRVINRAGSEHIVFALVMEDVDNKALGLNYATDLRIQLHKKTGQMICTTMTTGRIESYHESQQVAAELQPYWREFKDLHVACDLSEMVRRIIASLQATALRAEEKLMRLKAERAFLDAGGARCESARRWPSVLTPSVLTEEVRRRGGKPDLQRGVGG